MALISLAPLHLQLALTHSRAEHTRPATTGVARLGRAQGLYFPPAAALCIVGVCLADRRRRCRGASRHTACRSSLRPLPPLPAEGTPPALSPLRFGSHANWVAPGHLLVGRYPLTSPKESQGRDLVRRLVREARVSTFVCFQEEVPPQTELAKWPRDGVRLHGRRCLPYSSLARQFAAGQKLDFLHQPIRDLEAPGLDELHEVVNDLHERILNKEVLYLHCWGGRGRSAAVAACLLVRLYDISPEDALARIQHGYDSRDYDNCVSPERESQRQVFREFCDMQRRLQSRAQELEMQ